MAFSFSVDQVKTGTSKTGAPARLHGKSKTLLTTVAIIGAGPLGRWLALRAAQAGFRVLLEDVMPANLHHANEYLRQELNPDVLARGNRPEPSGSDRERPEPGVVQPGAVEFVGTVEDAVREADLAIDCVPDELESKLEILWLLDRMAPPKTIIATPTIRLDIADLAACTYRAEKCVALGIDPRDFSPEARVMIVKTSDRTARETVEIVSDLWKTLGFAVEIECRR